MQLGDYPVTREEHTRLIYVRDVGLIVVGPGLTTRQRAIEASTQRKRRTDRIKGKLEPPRWSRFNVSRRRGQDDLYSRLNSKIRA